MHAGGPDGGDAGDSTLRLDAGGTPCVIPPGAHASVGAAVPRPGLHCMRYPAVAQAPRDVLVAADGTIFVSEMGGGRVSLFVDETFVVFAEGLAAPIGLRELPDGDLLVTEESSRSLARIDVTSGDATEYATGLRLAEGLFFEPDGSLVVAEFDVPSAVVRYPPGGGPRADVVATGFDNIYGLLSDRRGGVLVADHAGRIARRRGWLTGCGAGRNRPARRHGMVARGR